MTLMMEMRTMTKLPFQTFDFYHKGILAIDLKYKREFISESCFVGTQTTEILAKFNLSDSCGGDTNREERQTRRSAPTHAKHHRKTPQLLASDFNNCKMV